jgi:hypothetical protein
LQPSIPFSPPPPDWLRQKSGDSIKPLVPRNRPSAEEPVFLAFYAPWKTAGFESLKAHYRKITHLAPEWFSMKSFTRSLWSPPGSANRRLQREPE